MIQALQDRVEAQLSVEVDAAARALGAHLASEADAMAVLFYGSNLRTGSREGVLDFYVLLPGSQRDRIWPRVSYREWEYEGDTLRAKVATMTLGTFLEAARGDLRDTTIWARFVQPSALVWQRDRASAEMLRDAIGEAAQTAARLAVALGPERGTAEDFWRTLFRATYQAEFRVEKPGREDSILSVNAAHFDGLLPLALSAQGIPFERDGEHLIPHMPDFEKGRVKRWWSGRRRLGKPLNLLRLAKASTTFEGASRYAAWKIERHTGIELEVTPFREKHPLLAAPGVVWALWKAKRSG